MNSGARRASAGRGKRLRPVGIQSHGDGEEDIFTPRSMAEEIDAAQPNSTLHLYSGWGHAFHGENLDAFNQGVLDFIRANS